MNSNPASNQRPILLAHGGGGQMSDELISQSILPRLSNEVLAELLDSGIVSARDGRIALTIDSYVVQPLEFPGGDIGRLCVCGTVNDLAVCGARPVGLALSLILAEGLDRQLLERVLDSISAAAREAGVRVITGDTKVVGRGQADGMYITTAGVGLVPRERDLSPRRVRPGDVVLINGPIAEHGLAVLLAREMPEVRSVLRSDVAPLNSLIEAVLAAAGQAVVFMRDPTRGGLSGLAADLARSSTWHLVLYEEQIAVHRATLHAAEMLGVDPLDVANEGKVVLVCRPDAADTVLKTLHAHPLGRQAAIIGRVESPADGVCELRTAIGGRRVLQKPYGQQLPRIC